MLVHSNEIFCATCGRQILNESYVRCLRCRDFDQCLECLSSGREVDKRHQSHSFVFVSCKNEPKSLYRENWETKDELNLLVGIKKFGLGNWEEVSEFVGNKTPVECETYYVQTFLKSPSAPKPISEVLPPCELPPPPPYDTKPQPSEYVKFLKKQKLSNQKAVPAEFNGYMPYRHEFEIEFNNEAEQIIANISFKDEPETEETFRKKIQTLRCYNYQIEERRKRTRIIENVGMLYEESEPFDNENLHPDLFGGVSLDDKLIDREFASLIQFIGFDKAKQLAVDVRKQMELKRRLEERYIWKANSIKNQREGELYSDLMKHIKTGIIPQSEIKYWNEKVEQYNLRIKNQKAKIRSENLSKSELGLCSRESISTETYKIIKDVLMRESVLRNELTKEEAVQLAPDQKSEIEPIYDFLTNVGWIKS
ncbi:Myb-like DNA-binding domain containing protein [Histomonas meleagridis]|uniref:Myb-like DNA-binding domain containing protein n=1 Tax=Histomonas meleagridis TaxID=135588 RepID=UPI003559D6AA|nr:Myb-like DNA-binding domain containing protein [Histomonas meleagridis]KAH0797718.1 Myb-like DNA-binding domain containing protein [Histomonas meleagridis]